MLDTWNLLKNIKRLFLLIAVFTLPHSCRSVAMEEVKFWKFEGIVVLVGVIFAIIVTYRQRTLDRHAEQKVRRQLEEI